MQSVTSVVVSMTLVVLITAFLKEQFTLEGKATKWTALVVFVVVWGVPYAATYFPAIGKVAIDFLAALEVFLSSLGTPAFGKYMARQFSNTEYPNKAMVDGNNAVMAKLKSQFK